MNKFEYEKTKILERIQKDIKDVSLYSYRKGFIKSLVLEAKEKVKIDNLSEDIIKEVQSYFIDQYSIIFSMDETEGFLKLYTKTTLTLIDCGMDTDTLDQLSDNLFDFILYEMPAPLGGHQLTIEEADKYVKLLQNVSLYLGFDLVKS